MRYFIVANQVTNTIFAALESEKLAKQTCEKFSGFVDNLEVIECSRLLTNAIKLFDINQHFEVVGGVACTVREAEHLAGGC